MARRRIIKGHVAKGTIPGVDGGSDALVTARDAPAVQSERRRAARRGGATGGAEKSQDAVIRSHGIPVFDRRTGQAELNGYIAKGRGR